MNANDGATTLPADAEPVPAAARLSALRQALAHVGTATATLIDAAAELRQAGVPGLAWDSDFLTDQVDSLAGAIALLMQPTEDQTGPTDQGVCDRAGRAD